MTIKGKEVTTSLLKSINVLDASDSESEKKKKASTEQQQHQQLPVASSSNVIQLGDGGNMPAQQPPLALLAKQQPEEPAKRETFSFWKNSAPASNPPPAVAEKESLKEDVWDIAFSGGGNPAEDQPKDDPLSRLFNTNADSPKTLPDQILDILRSVAPAIEKVAANSVKKPAPVAAPTPRPPQHNFPVPIPKEKERPESFPSYGKPEYFDKTASTSAAILSNTLSGLSAPKPETSGGRIRSILKKIKDPQPAKTSSTIAALAASSQASSHAIPGLDDTRNRLPVVTMAKIENKMEQPLSTGASVNPYPAATDSRSAPLDHIVNETSKPLDPYNRYPTGPAHDPRAADSRTVDAGAYGQHQRPQEPSLYDRSRPHPEAHRAPPVGAAAAERTSANYLPPSSVSDPYAPSHATAVDSRQPAPYDPRYAASVGASSYERDVENYRRVEYERQLPPPASRDPYDRPPPQPVRDPPLAAPRSLEPLVAPVKRAGESEDEYYIRFEKYYEEKRRREAELTRSREYPPRRLVILFLNLYQT